MNSKVAIVKQELAAYRLEISTKETELLTIFNELISCDIYVAEDYFDKLQAEQLTRKSKQSETFQV